MAPRSPYAPRSTEVAQARGRVAAAKRWQHDPEQLADAERDLRAVNAAEYIKALVDTFPPLTETQKGRLAALLFADGHPTAPSAAAVEGGGGDG